MLSFREKSLWVSVLIIAIVGLLYGGDLYSLLAAGPNASSGDINSLMLQIVIVFVVLEIIIHAALAMDDQEGAGMEEDERERGYRLEANNIGYWILSIGVISCIVQQMINNGLGMDANSDLTRFAHAHIELKLIIVFWLSELARFGSELYYFRKDS